MVLRLQPKMGQEIMRIMMDEWLKWSIMKVLSVAQIEKM